MPTSFAWNDRPSLSLQVNAPFSSLALVTIQPSSLMAPSGMSRLVPYLAELQPEFFCEVSPALAAERGLSHGGWATIVTARSAVEARAARRQQRANGRAGTVGGPGRGQPSERLAGPGVQRGRGYFD